MRMFGWGLIGLLILAMIIPIQGFVSEDIVIWSDPNWAIAGGPPVYINVWVKNETFGGDIIGASVTVIGNDNTYGTIAFISRTTDSTGKILDSFVYTPKTLKGEGEIKFLVYKKIGNIDYQIEKIFKPKIDHAEPKKISQIIYSTNEVVDHTTNIGIQLKDAYNNTIDPLNKQEYLIFRSSETGNCGFISGSILSKFVTVRVEENGFANATYKMDTKVGMNPIQITAPSTVVTNVRTIYIEGLPDDPEKLVQSITSTYNNNENDQYQALANGKDVFQIMYFVFDSYDNPVPGIKIHWTSNNQNNYLVYDYVTNYQGLIYLQYGPSSTISDISINASTPDYPSINSKAAILSFVSAGPSQFVLNANPQIIASWEANPESHTKIRAKYIDDMGRPIVGEPVEFNILQPDTANTRLTLNSSFTSSGDTISITVLTNEFGNAIVDFYPGSFPLINESDFSSNATGTAIVVAFPKNNPKYQDEIKVRYKNYAYLHAETYVEPEIIGVNETVNVTINLVGDGYAPWLPIDVILCINRGDSMYGDMYYYSNKSRSDDKMVYAHEAAIEFANTFRENIDQVGLVTFGPEGLVSIPVQGNPIVCDDAGKCPISVDKYISDNYDKKKIYDDYSTVDLPLSTSFKGDALNTIKNITPSQKKGGTVAVPLRYGLYHSIKELSGTGSSSPNSSSIKAVVLLTDAQWTAWGDPTAGNIDGSIDTQNGYWEDDPKKPPEDANQGGISYWTAFREFGAKNSPLQDMALYAVSNNTRIYTIAYFEKSNNIPTSLDEVLHYLAAKTNGKYYLANNGSRLQEILIEIGEELKTSAGVNTSMELTFTNLSRTYGSEEFEVDGSTAFNYTHVPSYSTNITSWNRSTYSGSDPNPLNPTPISDLLPVNPYPDNAIYESRIVDEEGKEYIRYPYALNQTEEWENNRLSFYVGNITIGQTWRTKFTLKANIPGFINLFGKDSKICVDDDESPLPCVSLPDTYATIEANLTKTPESPSYVDVNNVRDITPSNRTDSFIVAWNLIYNSTDPVGVKQVAYYQISIDEGQSWSDWIQFGTNSTKRENIDNTTFSAIIDARELYGEINVKIFAYEDKFGGPSDTEMMNSTLYRKGNIKIY